MIIISNRDADSGTRLNMAGELDIATADEFLTRLRSSMADMQAPDSLLVDFTEVTFCDSSGIAALDELYADAAARGLSFRLANLQPGVRRVLQIIGLLEALTSSQAPLTR
ncbi:STAS domain-containing protein [Actinoplanes siamensis]|uniref:Anti-sigma factor antagonist n=1 Tax=Actinoplanes siamensis TaxID=1223317 RepID=A0A919NDD3_9ACTN|nr:STAS domain-containing protein [Actinoplanes siamensis]GIF08550.1 anti-sigma factor antagonist [Actinoplanes siamensis]